MQKILFIVSNFYPRTAAGGIVVEKVCRELIRRKKDVSVFVTYRNEGEQETEVYDGIRILRGQFHSFVKAVWRRCIKILVKVLPRTAGLLLWERHEAADARRDLEAYIQAERPDRIVSVCFPLHTHLLAKRMKDKFGLPWDAYYIDPFYNNRQYHVKNRRRMKRVEYKTIETADRVLMPSCNVFEYTDIVRADRIETVEYPLITKEDPFSGADEGVRIPAAEDRATVTCLFLGTFYTDVRRPEYVFSFIDAASKRCGVRLVCVGRRGYFPAGFYESWQQKLGEHVLLLDPVPNHEVPSVLKQADVLIDIGNTNDNQLPSKTIEYVNTGRPAVHFNKTKNCPGAALLEDYPLALTLDEKETVDEGDVERFCAFICEAAGKRVDREEILARYGGYTVEAAADTFLKGI